MATISGVNGTVLIGSTALFDICKWDFTPKCGIPKYCSNKTSGYRTGVAAAKDGSGTMDFKHNTTNLLVTTFDVGASVTLILSFNGTQNFTVPSGIESMKYTTDIDTDSIVGGTVDFTTYGAWTNPVASHTLPPDLLREVEAARDDPERPVSPVWEERMTKAVIRSLLAMGYVAPLERHVREAAAIVAADYAAAPKARPGESIFFGDGKAA